MTTTTPEPAEAPDSSAPKTPGQPGQPGQFSLDIDERGVPDAFRAWVGRLRTGDPGALPSVLGLVLLAVIFSQLSGRFLTKSNLGNIPGQGAYIAIIGLGLVFVLLLGEIDLSAGTAGGTCAAVAAVAVSQGKLHGGGALPNAMYWTLVVGLLVAIGLAVWLKAYTAAVVIAVGFVLVVTNLTQHLFLALVAAICIGAAIGVLNGYLVAKVGIPSFVVTLALFLAWEGVTQFALNGQPVTVSNYNLWYKLTYGNLSVLWTWIFMVVLVGGYLAYTLLMSVRARRASLAHDKMELVLLRGGSLAVVAIVITVLATQNRGFSSLLPKKGLPVPAAIALVLMVLCTLLLTKTTWGRHLYATGGNAEAARRAGIDVVHMKVTAFCLCTSFGALGGIMLSSYQSSASLDLGSGNVLLFSVAAAVIGGTSLFGGRGRPRDAIIGAIVIAMIPNGLQLNQKLGADPQWQSVITGVVLLLAAGVDAVSRRRGARS
jgi:D-xylose transport system permease protein